MIAGLSIEEFRPLERLALQPAAANALILRTAGFWVQASVLHEDLFRLRIAPGPLVERPSWAVNKTEWPPCMVRVSSHRGKAAIQSAKGALEVDHRAGSWELRDHLGLVLFSAGAGRTGFLGNRPRVALTLEDEEGVFGLGESTGTFNKRGLVREFWNIDVGGHADSVHPLLRNMYVSIPFALSLRHGRAAGLFWDNPAHQTWDIGQTEFDQWKLEAASGEIDLYFFLGPTAAEVLGRYTELTGRMPLPPLWALGYQQCRYSYQTQRRVEEVARTFRQKQIPCDVLYLDIHYMDGYRVFTFGKSFPRPRKMIEQLARAGFKMVTIVDPGVKEDAEFGVLQRGIKRRAFVKAPGGQSDYRGKVWPGVVRFPDFLNARVRQWWGEEQARFAKLGVAGFWNDMNEPADFSTASKDFPAGCVHRTDFGQERHETLHNVYGSQMARASFEGALASRPNQRPFVITRAGYAGLQRHACLWTGDNDSCWEHLNDSIQMLLNLSLSGVAFCGADVGGFHGNCTGELLARWMQKAALTPFFRNHSNLGTIDQEPWAFGPRIEAICRRYIGLRYQLLPFLYGLFVEAHRHGTPIMRPMFWHYQNDPRAVAAGDQFMLGSELIIAPILRQGATARSVYLPAGMWFDFWTGQAHRGGSHVLVEAALDLLPLFVRAGALLPMIALQQYIGERAAKVVNLHVWPGGRGALNWYEDDGNSLEYTTGAYYERRISLERVNKTARLQFGAVEGSAPSAVKVWRVLLRNASRPLRVKMSGQTVEAGFNREFGICAFEIENRRTAFEVSFAWD